MCLSQLFFITSMRKVCDLWFCNVAIEFVSRKQLNSLPDSGRIYHSQMSSWILRLVL